MNTKVEKEGYDNYIYKSIKIETKTQNFEALNVAIEKAEDEIDALKDDINNATTGTKAAYDAAQKAVTDNKAKWEAGTMSDYDYEQLITARDYAEDAYEADVEELETAEATMDEITAVYKVVTGGTTELQAAVDAYNKALAEAMAPVAEQAFAVQDATELYNDLTAEVDAMYLVINGDGTTPVEMTLEDYLIEMLKERYSAEDANIYNPYITIDGEIISSGSSASGSLSVWVDLYATVVTSPGVAGLIGAEAINTLIEGLETQKEKLQARNENYSKATTKEQTIAEQEAEIAGLEEIVNVLEIKVAQYKAALDAAVAEYDTDEEQPAA